MGIITSRLNAKREMAEMEAAAAAATPNKVARTAESQRSPSDDKGHTEDSPNDAAVVEYGRYGMPVLVEMCFSGDFEGALARLKSHPAEAAALDTGCRRESALHWACYNGAPTELVVGLVKAAPEMISFSPGWHEQGLRKKYTLMSHIR